MIDGSSTPPTMPALPVFVIRPATRPHRYAACSSSKTMGARFGPVREPDVVTKIVFGYSFADARGGVLELEAVAEHEARVLRRVGAKLLLEFRRRLHLHVRDGGAQLLLDRLETVVGARVPAGVRDGPGRQERDAEAGGPGGRLAPAAGDEDESGDREERQRPRLHVPIMPSRPIIER